MSTDPDPEAPESNRESQRRPAKSAPDFTTISGHPIRRLYTEADLPTWDDARDLGLPGEPPYTRGIHPHMYRERLWTMRQFAGFGSAAQTNQRFRYLLAQGQTGLSVAFDLPTLMGYDSDHPLAEGEVGKCGVAISSLADMETLFEGIPLAEVSVSMTINSPAAILWAMYLAVAEKQGASWATISGTLQNDILKEYIAQKEFIYPPEPSLRLVIDTIEFAARHTPKFNPVSISGYHIREAGSTAIQELAFTLRDGIEYVERAIQRGLKVDDFAPRLSFFFNAHNDFFEEIAKYRAARRLWNRIMRERFHARDPRSCAMRFHAQTAGASLTAQQPYNNVVRTALQAMAAVMGGTQSLHTNSLDEAWALPTEFAATLALRTQQVIAYETGVTHIADPFGGSYFVETLTNEIESAAQDYIAKIDALGGMVPAIERSYPQKEIADAAYRYQQALDRKQKIVVGVNEYVTGPDANQKTATPNAGPATHRSTIQNATNQNAINQAAGPQSAASSNVASAGRPIEILRIDESTAAHQSETLRQLRSTRSSADVNRRLHALSQAARTTDNLMPHLLDAVKSYATLGEICDTLRQVFGTHTESPIA